jgi:hypothetical protein
MRGVAGDTASHDTTVVTIQAPRTLIRRPAVPEALAVK